MVIYPVGKGSKNFLSSPFRAKILQNFLLMKCVLVEVKALIQAKTGVHSEGTHEGRSLESILFENLCQCHILCVEVVGAIVADSVI